MDKLKPNQFFLSGHLITELPILFQTELVKANMEDRKTQTRRLKKLDHLNDPDYQKKVTILQMGYNVDGERGLKIFLNGDVLNYTFIRSPYGKPGDLLWVRETWAKPTNLFPPQQNGYVYKADYDISMGMKWKPSIHMPKAAARLWLMVEDIRVERLQDISEADAIAEGCSLYGPFGEYRGSPHPNGGAMKYRAYAKAKYAFQCIWEEINGKASWKANPWVWVIKYRILSKTGRPTDYTILKNHREVTGQESYRFEMPRQDIIITAEFEKGGSHA